MKSITYFPLPGTTKNGRHSKTSSECVKTDAFMCGLAGDDPPDRDAWVTGVRHSLVLPTPWDGRLTTPLSKMDMDGWICVGYFACVRINDI